MAEIGTERVEPTARLPERLAEEPRREPRSGPRRKPPAGANNPDAEPSPEAPQHQIDSLA